MIDDTLDSSVASGRRRLQFFGSFFARLRRAFLEYLAELQKPKWYLIDQHWVGGYSANNGVGACNAYCRFHKMQCSLKQEVWDEVKTLSGFQDVLRRLKPRPSDNFDQYNAVGPCRHFETNSQLKMKYLLNTVYNEGTPLVAAYLIYRQITEEELRNMYRQDTVR